MNDSLVLQLQKLSINKDKKVSEVLSFALLVAHKLKQKEITRLLSPEAHGYASKDAIAPFRLIKGDLVAWDGKNEINIRLTSPSMMEFDEVKLSVSSIEHLCESNSGEFFYIRLDDKKVIDKIDSQINDNIFTDYVNLGFGTSSFERGVFNTLMPSREFSLKINKINYINILNSVRSIILAWAMYLEDNGFVGESFTFTDEEKIMAVNNTYNIGNLNGILGDVINSDVVQNNASEFKGNENLLREALIENMVSNDDAKEISNILVSEDMPKDNKSFSPKVREWLKKMISKSIDGTWDVSSSAAGGILTQIICRYYGFN